MATPNRRVARKSTVQGINGEYGQNQGSTVTTPHRLTARKSTLERPKYDNSNQMTVPTTHRLTARKTMRSEPEIIPDSESEGEYETSSSDSSTDSDPDEIIILEPQRPQARASTGPSASSKGKGREVERNDERPESTPSADSRDESEIPVYEAEFTTYVEFTPEAIRFSLAKLQTPLEYGKHLTTSVVVAIFVRNPSGVDFPLTKHTQLLRCRPGSLPPPEGFLDFEFISDHLFRLHYPKTDIAYSTYLQVKIQASDHLVEEILELPTPTKREYNSRHEVSEGIKKGEEGMEYEWRTYRECSIPEIAPLEGVLREGLVRGDREVRWDIANRMDALCRDDAGIPRRDASSAPSESPDWIPVVPVLVPSDGKVLYLVDTTPQAAPLEKYNHVAYSPFGYALVGEEGTLQSFPAVPGWEEDDSISENVLLKLRELGVSEGGIDEDSLVNYEALGPKDIGASRRDFIGLKLLMEAAGIEEKFFRAEEDRINQSIEETEAKSPAFEIFEKQTGRSAFEARRLSEHSGLFLYPKSKDISTVPLDEPPLKNYICNFCGAPMCTIHPVDVHAFNVPTFSKNSKPARRTACKYTCWRESDWRSMKTEWNDFQTSHMKFELEMFPETWSCNLASELKTTCADVHAHRIHSHPTPPPSPKLSKKSKASGVRQSLPSREAQGYRPCNHPGRRCGHCVPTCEPEDGPCELEGHCECFARGTYCDHFCGCVGDCSARFKGCSCSKDKMKACSDGKCPCHSAGRECDPKLCGCCAKICASSQIRNHAQIGTMIVSSEIPGSGFGLVVAEDTKEGDLIGVYAGEIYETRSSLRDLQSALAAATPNHVSYDFSLGKAHSVDGSAHANHLRFINASAEPNCRSREIYLEGTYQVAIYAEKDIEEGEELFLDYGAEYWSSEEEFRQ